MNWETAAAIATQAADVAIRRYGCSRADRQELINVGAVYLFERQDIPSYMHSGHCFNLALREMRKFNVEKHVRPDTREKRKKETNLTDTIDLIAILASLSDDEIKLIRLVFVEDLPQPEVAKGINRACVTVRYQMRKLIEKLRDRLGYRQGEKNDTNER